MICENAQHRDEIGRNGLYIGRKTKLLIQMETRLLQFLLLPLSLNSAVKTDLKIAVRTRQFKIPSNAVILFRHQQFTFEPILKHQIESYTSMYQFG